MVTVSSVPLPSRLVMLFLPLWVNLFSPYAVKHKAFLGSQNNGGLVLDANREITYKVLIRAAVYDLFPCYHPAVLPGIYPGIQGRIFGRRDNLLCKVKKIHRYRRITAASGLRTHCKKEGQKALPGNSPLS